MNFLLDWFEFLLNGIRQFIFGKPVELMTKSELSPKSELMPKPESEIELLPKNELISEPVEILSLELENGERKIENTIYTEEQEKRKVKCTTKEGKYFEVPWCLMMQSKIFSDMWTNLGQEEKVMATTRKQGINAGNNEHNINNDEQNSIPEPFVFQLPIISEKCFRRIVDWMRHRHGQPEFELKFGKETGQLLFLFLSILLRAIERMDKLFRIETLFLEQLAKVSKRYANASSMNSYKRGLFHLVEERNQILEELETNGMKELKEKLADLEEDINEYWVQRL